jgi:putative transposase
MIDRNHRLALTKQVALLGISRGSVYYEPVPVSDTDLALMRRLDELHLEFPFAGARMLRGLLAAEGSKVGRRHVTTLMRTMVIEAIYRRPNTSKAAPSHRVYPYLLRGLTIDRPNHVWATDITYISMARGFVYLAAVMDWLCCQRQDERPLTARPSPSSRRRPSGPQPKKDGTHPSGPRWPLDLRR